MKTNILILPEFIEAASLLSSQTKNKLFKVLKLLSSDYRHPSLQCKKVKGTKHDVYECRVDQEFRLIYDNCNNTLRCLFVGAHDVALGYAGKDKINFGVVAVDDIELAANNIESSPTEDLFDFDNAVDLFILTDIKSLVELCS